MVAASGRSGTAPRRRASRRCARRGPCSARRLVEGLVRGTVLLLAGRGVGDVRGVRREREPQRAAGPGSSGWSSTIVPGRKRVARSRSSGVRNRYSAASVASSRPATFSAGWRTTGSATRPAACWQPMSSTPSERPRSAMSTNSSLSGPWPSRGAYLLSSSSITNRSGSRPVPCFSSNTRETSAPTTNRCADSCSPWMSTTVTAVVMLDPLDAAADRGARAAGRAPCSRRRNAISVPGCVAPRPRDGADSGSSLSVEEVEQVVEVAHGATGARGLGGRAGARRSARTCASPCAAGRRSPPRRARSRAGRRGGRAAARTTCSTNPTWVERSSASVKQKRSRPWRMNSLGRPAVDGDLVAGARLARPGRPGRSSPPARGGTWNVTWPNGCGSLTPSARPALALGLGEAAGSDGRGAAGPRP